MLYTFFEARKCKDDVCLGFETLLSFGKTSLGDDDLYISVVELSSMHMNFLIVYLHSDLLISHSV